MTMTMQESAARHMAAGVTDVEELARLVESDTGKAARRNTLDTYRSWFLRHGVDWVDARRAEGRGASSKWIAKNPEKVRAKARRYREENPDRARDAVNAWRERYPARQLLKQCKQSAAKRELECTLTEEEVEAMLAPMACSATGLPLTWERDGDSYRRPWAPSIDRINCSKGYVPGNVRVVCSAFNTMRNEFPDEVVFALAKALAARAP
jgi:hypothetical protein